MVKKEKVLPIAVFSAVLILWQIVGMIELVPSFMLPTPYKIVRVLVEEFDLILENLWVTLYEAMAGLVVAVICAFLLGVMMERFKAVHDIFYPMAVVSQTIPTIAIAPLLVLWFGFGVLPKVLLVFITCLFPLLVAFLQGLDSADKNVLRLYRSMDASYIKMLFDVKIPYALESFFAGLRISASYSIVGAVISEWLGGEGGLGVYMTRVRKSFRFDKMFAVIIVISLLSLVLMKIVKLIEKKSMPWKRV